MGLRQSCGHRVPYLLGLASQMSPIAPLLEVVTEWAAIRGDIVGLALVGSWARGTALPDSDIDLILLTPNPDAFHISSAWLMEIDWLRLGLSVQSFRDAKYGVVWSRHVELSGGTLVEFSFGLPSWAATRPCDAGTQSVVSRGCRVLFDPTGLLQSVVTDAAQPAVNTGPTGGA